MKVHLQRREEEAKIYNRSNFCYVTDSEKTAELDNINTLSVTKTIKKQYPNSRYDVKGLWKRLFNIIIEEIEIQYLMRSVRLVLRQWTWLGFGNPWTGPNSLNPSPKIHWASCENGMYNVLRIAPTSVLGGYLENWMLH